MESIRDEQFNLPVGETQEEYDTIYANLDLTSSYGPMTIQFQLTPEELEELNRNGGKLYYQQCLFRKIVGFHKEVIFAPREKFHPMSIHVVNPLDTPG